MGNISFSVSWITRICFGYETGMSKIMQEERTDMTSGIIAEIMNVFIANLKVQPEEANHRA
jgi:hypothetical protein